MVLERCSVTFTDVNKRAYYGGDTVSGTVNVSLIKFKTLTDLTFQAKGETRCSWTETQGTGKNKRTVRYSSHEVHFRTITSLLIGYERKDEGKVVLEPGDHTFHFAFTLPEHIPTSIEKHWGRVRYTIKITAVRSMKFDDHYRMPFTVISKYDLNTNPSCSVPVTRQIQKGFNFLFASKGAMTLIVNLPISGFVPGQNVMMHCEIRNPSKVKIIEVKFSLVQHTTFVCTSPRKRSKHERKKIVEYAGVGVDKGGEVNYPVNFRIPALPPSTLLQHLITNEYFLKVKAFTSGMHSNVSELIPVTIGTVPLYSIHGSYTQNNLSAPSTSTTLEHISQAPSAPFENISQPPPYQQFGLPSYEESESSNKMTEADPEDKDSNVPFSPLYPVYTFPADNSIGLNINYNKK